jgi:hypothetical protein
VHPALLRRHPALQSTVIDIENVCVAGREIAEEAGLSDRIRDALNPNGRLILIDQFAPEPGIAPPSRLNWAFLGALQNPRRWASPWRYR